MVVGWGYMTMAMTMEPDGGQEIAIKSHDGRM